MTGELALRVQALPFVVLVLALVSLSATVVVVRGDRLLRLGILAICAVALPWATGLALAASTTDPSLALHLFRAANGSIPLMGAGLLLLLLAVSGRLDRHRNLVLLAVATSSVSTVVEWSTDLFVSGVQMTKLGMFYSKAGPLNVLHTGQILLWSAIGIVIARRGSRGRRDLRRRQIKRVLIVMVLAIAGTFDMLLAYGIIRIFPIAWMAGLFSIGVAMHAIFRTDFLQASGVDRPQAIELAAFVASAATVVVLAGWLERSGVTSPIALAVVTAPLPAAALVIGLWARGRQTRREPSAAAADQALAGFSEAMHIVTEDRQVAGSLVTLFARYAGLSPVQLWRVRGDTLVAINHRLSSREEIVASARATTTAEWRIGRTSLPFDARVRAWFTANPVPLLSFELGVVRLGGLRALIEAFVSALDADVVVPLVDRDTLVGLAAGQLTAGRLLRTADRDLVREAAAAAARALTFVALTAEAEAVEGTAREVEIANAMREARSASDVCLDIGPWRVAAGYRAAVRAAGDVWSWVALPGGRLCIVVADVVGRGVPAALLSSAVAGAWEATPGLLGGRVQPEGVLELLHDVVSRVGPRERASAFVILIDPSTGWARYGCAGHRGGYLLSPGPGGASVRALVARGTPLGDPTAVFGTGAVAVGMSDMLMIVSDGVVEVRGDAAAPWGERRLLRTLRQRALLWDDRAVELLLRAAADHAGGAPPDDDMVAISVRRR